MFKFTVELSEDRIAEGVKSAGYKIPDREKFDKFLQTEEFQKSFANDLVACWEQVVEWEDHDYFTYNLFDPVIIDPDFEEDEG